MLAPADTADIRFELVPFHGAEILAARRDDAVYVPMKRFCGSLGLKWDGARRRIERDQVLSEGAVVMTVPSDGGDQQQQTLPLKLIPGFLFGLDPSRYAPELRERVHLWRRDCYEVLFRHFFAVAPAAVEGADVMPAPSYPHPTRPAAARITAIRQAAEIAAQLRTEPVGPVRTFLVAALHEICAAVGMPTPGIPIEPEVDTGPTPAERIDALLAGLATLDARGVRFNHLGRQARPRFALNLPQLAALFRRHDIDVRVDDALRDALRVGTRHWQCRLETVPSRLSLTRRPTLCHLLERSAG